MRTRAQRAPTSDRVMAVYQAVQQAVGSPPRGAESVARCSSKQMRVECVDYVQPAIQKTVPDAAQVVVNPPTSAS